LASIDVEFILYLLEVLLDQKRVVYSGIGEGGESINSLLGSHIVEVQSELL
jgi:hypothetical protein